MTDIREETNEQDASQPDTPRQSFDLPDGSAVLQISLEKHAEDGDFELRVAGVLCGTDVFDPQNPCHRFLAVIADRLPELMLEIGGTSVERASSTAGVAANDPTVSDDVVAG